MKTPFLFKDLVLAMLMTAFAFTGCKKENNNPPEDTYDLITSQVIGPEGGTIISDNVIVSIPANALFSSSTIELYKSSAENPFGDEGNSDVFWIKGLPDPLINPIKLSVKYSGTLSDQSYIAFGKYVIATSGQDTVLSQKLVLAADSSGFLQATIPSGPLNNLKSIQYQGRYGIPFWSLSSYWYYQTDHFIIHFPGRFVNTGSVEALADGLEGAYDELYSMGFRYDARTSWPVEVTVRSLDEEIDGQTDRSFPWTANSGYIEINSLIMPDKPLTKTTGAHEFFHIVQDLYNYDEKYNWLQEASSVWFEEKFAVNPDLYVSDARSGHELAPFKGLQAGAAESNTHHGYGCSSVIKYLVGQYGDGIMKKIWEDCRDNNSHPIEAIKQATDPYVIWWMNFMRDYTLGNVYSDMSVALAVFNDNFSINSEQATQKTFERVFTDLSGYIYKIEPSYTGFKDSDKLQLTLTGNGRAMYAFKNIGSVTTQIGYNVDQLLIPDLKGFQASNSLIYVLVTNYLNNSPLYNSTSNIRLDIAVTGGSAENYTDHDQSKNDTLSICLVNSTGSFFADAICTLNSPQIDFRIHTDSAAYDAYKFMEVKYLKPSGNYAKSLDVNLSLNNLRKNQGSGFGWDNPYVSKIIVNLYDKNGSRELTFNNSSNCSFLLEYNEIGSSASCWVDMQVKDLLDPTKYCNSNVLSLTVYPDNK